jgi:hypothetical protein
MSTTLPSEECPSAPDDLHEPAEMRGAQLAYGSDEAPVLLQLPNLLPPSAPSSSEVTAPTDELAPVEPPAETASEGPDTDSEPESTATSTNDRQQERREERRHRRKPSRPTTPTWFNNIGQYVFAVILASVLFAVFVTWKERKKDVSSTDPPSPPAVNLPTWDNDPSALIPGAGRSDVDSIWGTSPATSDSIPSPPTTASASPAPSGSPGIENSSAPGLGVPEFRLARQPEQPEGAVAPTRPYPDTGASPLGRDALTTQGGAPERWGDNNRVGPTRQASRPSSDQRSR